MTRREISVRPHCAAIMAAVGQGQGFAKNSGITHLVRNHLARPFLTICTQCTSALLHTRRILLSGLVHDKLIVVYRVSYRCTRTHSPRPPSWSGVVPNCLHVVYRYTFTHSLHPPVRAELPAVYVPMKPLEVVLHWTLKLLKMRHNGNE